MLRYTLATPSWDFIDNILSSDAISVKEFFPESGLFENNSGTVTSLISRPQLHAMQSRKFVEDTFDGSLPAFVAAFTKDNSLTPEEAALIRAMIDQAEER